MTRCCSGNASMVRMRSSLKCSPLARLQPCRRPLVEKQEAYPRPRGPQALILQPYWRRARPSLCRSDGPVAPTRR